MTHNSKGTNPSAQDPQNKSMAHGQDYAGVYARADEVQNKVPEACGCKCHFKGVGFCSKCEAKHNAPADKEPDFEAVNKALNDAPVPSQGIYVMDEHGVIHDPADSTELDEFVEEMLAYPPIIVTNEELASYKARMASPITQKEKSAMLRQRAFDERLITQKEAEAVDKYQLKRREQNRSLCGCPMCTFHSDAYEIGEKRIKSLKTQQEKK